MPTYQYRCSSCHKEEEVIQKISAQPLTTCPFCKEPSFKRVPPRQVAIQFQGSGFYKTDYVPSASTPSSKDAPTTNACGKSSCKCH